MGAAGGPPRASGNAHFSGNSYFGSHGNAAGGSGKRHAQDRTVKLELDIQKSQMGKLIGTGGKTIQNIQQRAQTIQLRTPWKEDVEKIDGKFVSVVLHGRAGDVFKCAENVAQVVDICLAVLSVSILPNHVIFLMSDGVRNIQKEVPIDTLKLPRKSDKAPRVVLEGYFEDVWKVRDLLFCAEDLIFIM